ncbi:hypothetical protein SDC9_96325 [bioreactor metagenome]|uniref:Uncharacterized protein n=1 Tax=bioreactor metagenome TaxID=1076179 RepID=A0A645A8R8_9ZZZZ
MFRQNNTVTSPICGEIKRIKALHDIIHHKIMEFLHEAYPENADVKIIFFSVSILTDVISGVFHSFYYLPGNY